MKCQQPEAISPESKTKTQGRSFLSPSLFRPRGPPSHGGVVSDGSGKGSGDHMRLAFVSGMPLLFLIPPSFVSFPNLRCQLPICNLRPRRTPSLPSPLSPLPSRLFAFRVLKHRSTVRHRNTTHTPSHNALCAFCICFCISHVPMGNVQARKPSTPKQPCQKCLYTLSFCCGSVAAGQHCLSSATRRLFIQPRVTAIFIGLLCRTQ